MRASRGAHPAVLFCDHADITSPCRSTWHQISYCRYSAGRPSLWGKFRQRLRCLHAPCCSCCKYSPRSLLQKNSKAGMTCRASSDMKSRWKQGAKDYVGRSAEGILRGRQAVRLCAHLTCMAADRTIIGALLPGVFALPNCKHQGLSQSASELLEAACILRCLGIVRNFCTAASAAPVYVAQCSVRMLSNHVVACHSSEPCFIPTLACSG